jgi:hypothetical protein
MANFPTNLPVQTESRPGARWWRVDLHAHSPASFDFGAEEGKTSKTRTSFRDWLLAYMRSDIDAIVITDHNTHLGIDEAHREIAAMEHEGVNGFRSLHILTGVELTVDSGYHLLAVFDVDTPSEVVNALLHRCGFQGDRGTSNATTSMSFTEVVDEIVKKGGLAIPAHADGAAGIFDQTERSHKDLFNSDKVFAVEIISDEGMKKAERAGWIPVLGSDAHHLNDSGCPEGVIAKYPGSHFTWIKMEQPNLFGLKLALADGSSSVIPGALGDGDRNDFTHSAIESIVIESNGDETEYRFGPWMNSIIGGRGVGKSTLVEIMRLVMGRFEDLPTELQDNYRWFSPESGRGENPRFWSSEMRIRIHLTRSGRKYRILWEGADPRNAQIEVLEGESWRAEGGVPRDRFPILLNSQKQIYEMAREPQCLLRTIDDHYSIGRVAWQEKFDALCGQYRRQRSEIREIRSKIGSEDHLRGQLADIDAQLEQISKLRDSPEARELDQLVSEELELSKFELAAKSFEQDLMDLLRDHAEFESSLDQIDPAEDIGSPLNQDALRRHSVISAYNLVLNAAQDTSESRMRWETFAASSPRSERMRELREILSGTADPGAPEFPDPEHQDLNEVYARLLTDRGDLELTLSEIEKAKSKLDSLVSDAALTLEAVSEHREALTSGRQLLAKELTGNDLKLQVFAQADDLGSISDLRRLTSKLKNFDSEYSERGLLSVLGNAFHPARPSKVSDLKKLLKELRTLGARAPMLQQYPKISIDQRFYTHLKSLDLDHFETEVDLWFPEDRLSVKYSQDGINGFREIDQGSPGQKTAAMLAVILRLNDDPLVLDQPEDDLDNKLIYDLVVSTLKRIKSDRQVIVVTHNANVVVNADAEHVMILHHGSVPNVEAQGSIQDAEIKRAICLIMEGGELAFAARYRKLMG